ncbi:MAG: hypothetical protein ACRDZ8_13765 [Acidimicrobiales bacterium]
MNNEFTVVEGVMPTAKDRTNLRKDCWSIAFDQRAFGPRRLVVAFADRRCRLLGMAHTPRTDPPEKALPLCIEYLGRGAALAVAFCDEPVQQGPPPPEVTIRFAKARSIAESYGIFLVDWIACDDQLLRSSRAIVDPDGDWWRLPVRRS